MNNKNDLFNYNIILMLVSILIIILIIYVVLYKRNNNNIKNIVESLNNLYEEDKLINEFNIYDKNFNNYLTSLFGGYVVGDYGIFVIKKTYITFKDELIINNKINFNNNRFVFIIFFNLIIDYNDIIKDSTIYNYIITFGSLKIHLKITNINNNVIIYNNNNIFINSDLNILVYKFVDDELVNNKYIDFSLLLDDNKFIIKKIIIKNYDLTDNEINYLINNS